MSIRPTVQEDSSAAVRRASLHHVNKSKRNMAAVLTRLHDVDVSLRGFLYRSLERIPLKNFSSEQCLQVLKAGFYDR